MLVEMLSQIAEIFGSNFFGASLLWEELESDRSDAHITITSVLVAMGSS
jgi:hypothetical protein